MAFLTLPFSCEPEFLQNDIWIQGSETKSFGQWKVTHVLMDVGTIGTTELNMENIDSIIYNYVAN